jgi:hypothetical protein
MDDIRQPIRVRIINPGKHLPGLKYKTATPTIPKKPWIFRDDSGIMRRETVFLNLNRGISKK